MNRENLFNTNNTSSFLFASTLIMQCEKLLSVVLNRTAVLNNQALTPPYIRQLLAKQNLTLRLPKTVPECVIELQRLINNSNENTDDHTPNEPTYVLEDRSRSLIVFVFFIAFVSFVSIIGNLCLAKVLYSKRFRLLQTDRIVLCLALSELCLVLIDSPTEIYRFLSYSFSQTWLCRFHTFFESLFSSCIIFYHLLGAFDRFVYIHGHTSTDQSLWSTWCRRMSTKSCSIILLFLPIVCSFPIAICNLLHAHVLHTSSNIQICIVQYTHKILISFLIFFYILPLLFAFFLHGKLIYFIRSRHNQHYFTTTNTTSFYSSNQPYRLSTCQTMTSKQRRILNQAITNRNQQLLNVKKINSNNNRRIVMFNVNSNRNSPGSGMTTMTTIAAIQQVGTNHSSVSSASSRSSNGTAYASLPSPIVLYKINSQANANAKRTVLLLVLLLSSYVLCWAPYNIYTWIHAYQLTTNRYENLFNRTQLTEFNESMTKLSNNIHADLRRVIFINYSLYLLSMISMCFSFIFYFSLNKQARQELTSVIGCICPWSNHLRHGNSTKNSPSKGLLYQTRYQNNNPGNNLILSMTQNNNHRVKTTTFKTHRTLNPSMNQNQLKKNINPLLSKIDNGTLKRPILNYGCHVQCCP